MLYVSKQTDQTDLNSIYDCIMQPQFSYCLICWFGFLVGTTQTLLIAHVHLVCWQLKT